MTTRPLSEWDAIERRLDDLVRPSVVVDPPPVVQADLLAAVLLAADAIYATPIVSRVAERPIVAAPAALSPLVYVLVAALVGTYLAVVGTVGPLFGAGEWLPVLLAQLQTAASLLAGSSGDGLPGVLGQPLAELAPWLALAPLLWYLWDRDRAALKQS